MARLPLYCIALFVLALCGCTSIKLDSPLEIDESDWPTEGGSYLREHDSETSVDPPLVEVWRYDAGAGTGVAGSLIVDSLVFVGTRKGQVLALNLETGKKIGRMRLDVPIEGGMTIHNSTLYVPMLSAKKTVLSYDMVKGKTKWKIKGAPVESGLLVYNDKLIIIDTDAIVRSVNSVDGSIVWETELGFRTGVVASPILIGKILVVADELGKVHGLDSETGEVLWTNELSAPVYTTMTSDGTQVFVPTTRGRLYSLDGKSGVEKWSYALPDTTVRFSASGYDQEIGQVVVGGTDGILRSFDSSRGDIRWSTPLEGAIMIAPLFTESTLYIGTLRRLLYALDKKTGQVLWEENVKGRVKSAMAAQNGKIIVMAETQQIIMFVPESNNLASSEE